MVTLCSFFSSSIVIPDLVPLLFSFFDADWQLAFSHVVPNGLWECEELSLLCAIEKQDSLFLCKLIENKKALQLVASQKTFSLIRLGLEIQNPGFVQTWCQYWTEVHDLNDQIQIALSPLANLKEPEIHPHVLERVIKVIDFYQRIQGYKETSPNPGKPIHLTTLTS